MTKTQVINFLLYAVGGLVTLIANIPGSPLEQQIPPAWKVWVNLAVLVAAYAKSHWNFSVAPDGQKLHATETEDGKHFESDPKN